MFVLLQHDPPDPGAAPHWDLLVEVAGHERLPTWRLAADPVAAPGPIAAERIADHRRVYLDFEGELSGGRGRVRRLDRGPCEVESFTGAELMARLEGAHWRGRVHVRLDRGKLQLVMHTTPR